MKKRKKDTGLSLQASISEKEKRTVTSGFLAIVPVCYMILGVFGWMKTALGIINVVYDADLLYGVLRVRQGIDQRQADSRSAFCCFCSHWRSRPFLCGCVFP